METLRKQIKELQHYARLHLSVAKANKDESATDFYRGELQGLEIVETFIDCRMKKIEEGE